MTAALPATPPLEGLTVPPRAEKPTSLKPLDDFRNWAERYLAAPPERRTQLLPEGTQLATARAETMAGLIKFEPEVAIGALLPYSLRRSLPPEVAAKIEYPVRGRGDLMVLAVRPLPDLPVEEPIIRTARIGDTDFRAYTFGKRLADISRTDLPILGVGLTRETGPKLLAVRENAYEVLEPAEAQDIRAAEPAIEPVCPISGDPSESKGDETAVATGVKIVWLCSHGHIGDWLQTPEGEIVAAAGGSGNSGGSSPVVPATYTQGNKTFLAIRVRFSDQAGEPASDATMQTELQKVVNAWSTWSYGKLQGSFAFSPTLVLPQTEGWYAANGTDGAVLEAARRAGAAYTDGTGAHPYDTANFDFDCVVFQANQFAGYCGLGYVGGKGAWIKCTGAGIYLHEWGHNLGLWHANYLQPSTDSPIGPGTHIEYGNSTSTMGAAGLNAYDTLERYTLHWLEPADVATIHAGGTYRLYNADKSALTASHPYALRIYKEDLVYYVEYRPNWDPGTPHAATTNGAMICWTQQSDQLLDMNPLGSGGSGDASLIIGRSFFDPGQGMTVTPIARGGISPDDYLDVVVNFSNPSANSAPVAVLTASNFSPGIGASVTLNATASDPDGDALAYSWDFDDGNVSTNNNPSQTKSWSGAGDYSVRCTISDMKGRTSVQSILIRVGTPGNFTISGRVTQSNGTPVPDVLVQDTNNHLAYTDAQGNYSLGPLGAGSYTITALHHGWTLAGQTSNPVAVGPSAVNVNFTATPPAPTGSITLEHWDGIGGNSVTDLTGNSAFPNTPTYITALESTFEAPSGVADNYGQRARGWFRPPTTGAYTFYISSDDNSELWLSTNATVASKVKIASVTGYSDVQQWTKFPSQKSAAITLTAGQRYYIEALHKEGVGGDHLAVGVDFPNASQHRPIENTYLDPITAPTPVTPANTITVAATASTASETGPAPGTFTLTRTGSAASGLTVYFNLTGSANYGADYSPTGLTASFASGATTTTVTVTPVDDTISETSETVTLSLATSLAYAVGGADSATVTIADNEAGAVTLVATDATADESGSNPGVFTFTRTGDNTASMAVNFTISGSATNGTDYPALGTSVTIPAGQSLVTLTIAPIADGVFETAETVILTLANGAGYTIGSPSSGTVTIAAAFGTGGGILREWWDNISNTNFVYDLTNLASYPGSPTGSEIISTAFTTGENRADNFGERWRAIYTAPVSGDYLFYIASDDYSELWLSTDATPDRRQKIASVSGATGFQNWTQYGSQKSAAIPLVAGQRYYIEAIFKEGGGGDHMSIGVEYPNGALERPIPAHRLDPFTAATALPTPWTGTDIGMTGAPGSSGLANAILTAPPKNRYSFSGTANAAIADGATLIDSIGGATANLRGAGAVFNGGGNSVDLPGGSSASAAYIDLPNGLATGTYAGGTRYTSATYETWVTVQTAQNWSRVFEFGINSAGEVTGVGGSFNSSSSNDVLLTATQGTSLDQQLARYTPALGGRTRESSGTTVLGTQVHLVMLYDAADQNWRWYRNGALMQVLPDSEGLSTLNDVNNWLGRSGWSADSNIDALYNEFRIYDYALSEAQIRGNTAAGPDTINSVNFGNSGPYFVAGSGTLSTSASADGVHLETQLLSGDWDVRARLVSLRGGVNAVAGLTVREGTGAGSRHAFVGLKSDGTGRFINRVTANANAANFELAGLTIPQWLRIVRSGNTVTGFVSADNVTWTQLGATATFGNLASSVQIGFAVASGTTANSTGLAQFDSVTFSPSPGTGDGFLYERFEGLPGSAIPSPYPATPALREVRGGYFEAATSSPDVDYFAARLRGYFTAPQTGNYTFYVAADDVAELYLSTNETAAARVKIASVPSNSGFRVWTRFPQQKSAAIALVTGKRYYLEALHKELTGPDYLSVAVTLPDGTAEFPMLASRSKSYTPPTALGGAWTSADVGSPSVGGSSGSIASSDAGTGDALPLGPRHRYTFNGAANGAAADGTTLVDSVGGQHGSVRGAGAAFDTAGAGLSLPGGGSGSQAYVDLPNGVATGTENGGARYASVTYELWLTQRTARNWSRLMDFGTNSSGDVVTPGGSFSGTNFVMLSGNIIAANDQRLDRTGSNGTSHGTGRDSAGATVLNQIAHIVLQYDAVSATWRWYRNGTLMATLPDTVGLTGLDDVNVWLGRSNFSQDQNLDAVLHEFRVYNYALTPSQIVGDYATGPDVVNTIDNALPRAPRHRWTFNGAGSATAPDGTWIYDKIGGANALVRGGNAAFDAAGGGVTLPGGASNAQAYIDLPNGVASGTYGGGTRYSSVTYESWTTQNSNQASSRIWDFGTGVAGELSGPGGGSIGTNYVHLAANNLFAQNPRFRRKTATADVQANITGATILNQLSHHVVSYDAAAQQWLWWENGVLLATVADPEGVATLADVNDWLGRSQSTTEANFAGTFHEFRIYDYALNTSQVLANLDAGPDALNVATTGLPGQAIVSGGGDITSSGNADSFQFSSQTMDGDGEIIARLVALQNVGTSPKAGVMLRENSAAGSRRVFLGLTPTGTGRYGARTTTDAGVNTTTLNALPMPQWLRLVRKGDVVTGFASPDGSAWTQVSTTTLSGFPVNALVGLAASSSNVGVADAHFDNVQINRPTVTISATQNAAEPAQNGAFAVTRTWETTSPLAVSYTIGGTAMNGTDYQSLSGTVTIPAGQSSATISVVPIDDALTENPETVALTLIDAAGYVLGAQASDTLVLSDSEPLFIWTNLNTGSTLPWSQNANWQGGAAPTANAGAVLEFFTGQTLPNGTVTSNNDLAGTFQIGTLRLTGAGPTSGTVSMNITGGALSFSLTGAAIALETNAGPGATVTLANPVGINVPTNLNGNGTATFVLAGDLTGGGSLSKFGTATVALTGTNSYVGTTSIGAGGVLRVGNGTATGTLGNGAITNNGTLDFRRTDTALNVASAIGGSGGISVNGSPASAVTLSGPNMSTGATTITSGTLVVNGNVSAGSGVTVAVGGTLAGTGTITPATTINGAHNAGDGVGAQTFSSALTYGSTAHLKWELAGNTTTAGSFDKVNAASSVNVTSGAVIDPVINRAGTSVDLTDAFWTQSHSWQILSGGSVSGSFVLGTPTTDSAEHNVASFGSFALQQTATTVTLTWNASTPAENWQRANFGVNWNNPAVASEAADPDHDGHSNLLERALRGNPMASDPLVVEITSGGKAAVTFSRDTANTDLILTVQAADNPAGPWIELARSTVGGAFTVSTTGATVIEPSTGQIRAVEVRDLYLIADPAHPTRFLRVQAQH